MSKELTSNQFIIVRKSSIHSRGVFAKKFIPKGTRIIEYVGEKITKAESERRAHIPLKQHADNKQEYGAVYLFELNKRYDIDGYSSHNTARFINHSCNPNCETDIIRGKIWIIATRDIQKEEELSYNYGYSWDDYDEHECHCREDNCVGYILAKEHWPRLKRLKSKKSTSKKSSKADNSKK